MHRNAILAGERDGLAARGHVAHVGDREHFKGQLGGAWLVE